MKRASLVVIIGLAWAVSGAQQSRLDALEARLAKHTKEDGERVDLLIRYVRTSYPVDPFESEEKAKQAERIARRMGDRTRTAIAIIAQVTLHQMQYMYRDEAARVNEAFALDPTFGDLRELGLALNCRHWNEVNAGRRSDMFGPEFQEYFRIGMMLRDTAIVPYSLSILSSANWASDPLKADSAWHAAMAWVDQPGWEGSRSGLLEVRAWYLQSSGDTRGALDLFDSAATTALLGGARFEYARCQSGKGYVLWDMGNYPAAVEQLIRTIKLIEQFDGDIDGLCMNEDNLGCVYREMGDLKSALPHFQRSYELSLLITTVDRKVMCLNDLGLAELVLGDPQAALDKFTEALRLSPGVRTTMGEQGLAFRLVESQRNIGMAKAALGDLQGAIAAFEAGIRDGEAGGVHLEVGTARVRFAEELRKAKPPQLDRAARLFEQAAESARVNGWMNIQRDALKGLYEVRNQQGDAAGALRYLKEYLVVKDSLLSADKARAISNLQIQYETEKKEQQIVLLGKDKEVQAKEIQKQKLVRNGFMGGFALVALFAGVFFFQRNRISKEKKRSEELLLNILPEEVAEELKAKGEADARQIDQVTVLFTDFKGFTAMSEKLTAKELVADIHECFSAFDHIMVKHGIEKIKTIGDAYMAAGGLPTPNSTHALDVVKAASEIRDFIAEGKALKLAKGLPYFEIRIGIHTGPVVAGIVGVKKFQYDIWGDTVNTASRMESSGEVGQVNISEATYALVKEEPGLTFITRGKVQAKGKGEMEMFFVQHR